MGSLFKRFAPRIASNSAGRLAKADCSGRHRRFLRAEAASTNDRASNLTRSRRVAASFVTQLRPQSPSISGYLALGAPGRRGTSVASSLAGPRGRSTIQNEETIMKLGCMGAIALGSGMALAGCGGEESPGPQPVFADAGAPSGPAGSRWSETGGGAARGEVEATTSAVSGLVIAHQEYFPTANSTLRDPITGNAEYYVATKTFPIQADQLSIAARCLGGDVTFVAELHDYDARAPLDLVKDIVLSCNGAWQGPTPLFSVRKGHRFYMTGHSIGKYPDAPTYPVPKAISLVAYRRG